MPPELLDVDELLLLEDDVDELLLDDDELVVEDALLLELPDRLGLPLSLGEDSPLPQPVTRLSVVISRVEYEKKR